MNVTIDHNAGIECGSVKIKVKNKEYQLIECPEGMKIMEISNNKDMIICPDCGNAIVLKD